MQDIWWRTAVRFRVSIIPSAGEFVFCECFPIRMNRSGRRFEPFRCSPVAERKSQSIYGPPPQQSSTIRAVVGLPPVNTASRCSLVGGPPDPHGRGGGTAGSAGMPHPKTPCAHPGHVSPRKGEAAPRQIPHPCVERPEGCSDWKILIYRRASTEPNFRLQIHVSGGLRQHHARNLD